MKLGASLTRRNGYLPIWLTLIVIVFACSAFFSIYKINKAYSLIDENQGSSIWSLHQLQSEWQKFEYKLALYPYLNVDYDNLMLDYEILWSRFSVLLEGRDAEQLRQNKETLGVINRAFIDLRSIETDLKNLRSDRYFNMDSVKETISSHLSNIQDVSLSNYHFNRDFFNSNSKHLLMLQRQLGFSLLGLVLSGAGLLAMLLLQNRKNLHQSMHDGLTGLPNRTQLHQWLDGYCRQNVPFALHLLDLNGFKDINDTLGHHSGDRLLKEVANRLRCLSNMANVRVARLGGDEFAVLQFSIEDFEDVRLYSNKLIATLATVIYVDENPCFIAGSLGTAIYPLHSKKPQELLSHADMAMYEAKKQGPESAWRVFEYEMTAQLARRHKLQLDLRKAIQLGGLQLEYQPIFDIEGKSLYGLEALLRWYHPEYGSISPLEIIEIAEQYGLAMKLGEWVITQACRQNRLWLRQELKLQRISVNISPSMYRSELVKLIKEVLHKYSIEARYLTIEVTEDTTMHVLQDSKNILPKLHEIGVSIALDDFGTGLSSLSHLKDLPVQTLKIDRSFVSGIDNDEHAARLVKSIVQLGHNLNMAVVAEGIESVVVKEILKEVKCDYGQGYLYSKPLVPNKIVPLIKRCGLKTVEGDKAEIFICE
ncbi:putative bifunctional diguanylate cyclase/phosphodiesterase [Marinobacterium arenosum]|uniref:putative bifunctional diguanylate cyclase/phosphodiesterase n=1 Tax=Marinobacterium arenosum TaxID=2862496 RepID=UPI001C956BAD|nr:bifunctional diguanylate cyclase/phosphodiesterase [Marinobacterium arenosum]MBY4677130.1 bifunctional diguanylate cyclase/phosphodiesterase [Marinobacterium arenosum]